MYGALVVYADSLKSLLGYSRGLPPLAQIDLASQHVVPVEMKRIVSIVPFNKTNHGIVTSIVRHARWEDWMYDRVYSTSGQ